jgi:hypothetical protein
VLAYGCSLDGPVLATASLLLGFLVEAVVVWRSCVRAGIASEAALQREQGHAMMLQSRPTLGSSFVEEPKDHEHFVAISQTGYIKAPTQEKSLTTYCSADGRSFQPHMGLKLSPLDILQWYLFETDI